MISAGKVLLGSDNLQALTIWLLATGIIGLLISIIFRLRFGRIFALVLITISAPILWPVCHSAFHQIEPSATRRTLFHFLRSCRRRSAGHFRRTQNAPGCDSFGGRNASSGDSCHRNRHLFGAYVLDAINDAHLDVSEIDFAAFALFLV
jgi:hypothetical protein